MVRYLYGSLHVLDLQDKLERFLRNEDFPGYMITKKHCLLSPHPLYLCRLSDS